MADADADARIDVLGEGHAYALSLATVFYIHLSPLHTRGSHLEKLDLLRAAH